MVKLVIIIITIFKNGFETVLTCSSVVCMFEPCLTSLNQSTHATALQDLYVADKVPSIQDVYCLNVPQSKAKLMERGETQTVRGIGW